MTARTNVCVTFSFENGNHDPVSLCINDKTVGQDIYNELLDMGFDVDAITLYNSHKIDKLYEDDNVLDLLDVFKRSTSKLNQSEIPLLCIRLNSARNREDYEGSDQDNEDKEDRESKLKSKLTRITSIDREKQCIVFDFDCTLTKRHWYLFNNNIEMFVNIYSRKGPAYIDFTKIDIHKLREDYFAGKEDATKKVVELIWGDYNRIDMIKEFLTTARDRYEYDLFVSSRGLVEDIEKGLDLIDVRELFKNYQGTASPQRLGHTIRNQPDSCSNPKTKTEFILNCLYDSNYFDVIYIDDDLTEHNEISRRLPSTKWDEEGRKYYFVPGLKKDVGGGIGKDQIDELYHIIEEVVPSGLPGRS